MSRRGLVFAVCIVALAGAALALRLPRLAMRPMHPDEANQATKTAMLAGIVRSDEGYRYDPEEHHGPSLYWLTLPSLWLHGAEDFGQTAEADYRIVPVLFGAGLVLLLFLVADGLGRGAAVVAGVLTVVSPAMVFYSRYYVQEMLLVFFTLGAIACAWRYWRSGALGWAVAAGASLGMMHATKETWVLAAAAMVAAFVLTALWARWRDGAWPSVARGAEQDGPAAGNPSRRLRPVVAGLAAAAAFCAVAVALYSSFGADWRGPVDSVLAWKTYWHRGTEPGLHDNPPLFYLERLCAFRPAKGFFWTEGLIVGLAAVGCGVALAARSRSPSETPPTAADPQFRRFLAFYTLVLTGIYALIPYKTPWCMVSFLHGMILLAGVGAWSLLSFSPRWVPRPAVWLVRALALAALAAGVSHLGWECCRLNLDSRFCADPRNPYVYAHTSPDALNLAAQIERLAQVSPEGHGMVIHVVTPENYWPLPWYLRAFDPRHMGFWQCAEDWHRDTRRHPPPSVIILTPDVQEAVDSCLRDPYNKYMMYGLRPGVLVHVYVREDLWEAFAAAAASGG